MVKALFFSTLLHAVAIYALLNLNLSHPVREEKQDIKKITLNSIRIEKREALSPKDEPVKDLDTLKMVKAPLLEKKEVKTIESNNKNILALTKPINNKKLIKKDKPKKVKRVLASKKKKISKKRKKVKIKKRVVKKRKIKRVTKKRVVKKVKRVKSSKRVVKKRALKRNQTKRVAKKAIKADGKRLDKRGKKGIKNRYVSKGKKRKIFRDKVKTKKRVAKKRKIRKKIVKRRAVQNIVENQIYNAPSIDRGSIYRAIVRYKRYPSIAKRMGIQGDVTLSFRLNPDGSISSISTVGGHPILQKSARESLFRASGSFPKPATPTYITVTISYRLR